VKGIGYHIFFGLNLYFINYLKLAGSLKALCLSLCDISAFIQTQPYYLSVIIPDYKKWSEGSKKSEVTSTIINPEEIKNADDIMTAVKNLSVEETNKHFDEYYEKVFTPSDSLMGFSINQLTTYTSFSILLLTHGLWIVKRLKR
jgi:hypothetical protein